jgi:hypothetical protein
MTERITVCFSELWVTEYERRMGLCSLAGWVVVAVTTVVRKIENIGDIVHVTR